MNGKGINLASAINCECGHLGLTRQEYDEYKELLKQEQYAYANVSIARNDRTIQACDDTTEKVLAFQRLHNIPENMDIRI